MDIEPLWALGGWSIFLPKYYYCMATPRTTHTPATETFTKILLLSALVFFFLLVSPTNPTTPFSSASAKRVLLEPKEPASRSTNSMNLHPEQAHRGHGSSSASSRSKRPLFGAEEHEVPSGPNPVSNR